MQLILLSVLFYYLVNCCQVESSIRLENGHVLSLDSNNGQVEVEWSLSGSDISIPAQVPGGIYTDLMKNGIIGDVFLGEADVRTRIFSRFDWTYRGFFTLPNDFPKREITNIVFFGVDTVAIISVNKKIVGHTDNMFTRYAFPVQLQAGLNEIEVILRSPMKVANVLDSIYPTAPQCVPDLYHGECHANQLRKMQASFGWDWGPAFPSMGLWKSVQIETYNSAIIRDVTVDIKYSGTKWIVKIYPYLETFRSRDFSSCSVVAKLELGHGRSVTAVKRLLDRMHLDDELDVYMEMSVSNAYVETWWPNGLGKQPLYNMTVTYSCEIYPEEVSKKIIRVGFREIEFSEEIVCSREVNDGGLPVQFRMEEAKCDGRAFYFKVNDHAVFMKGTNWIPASILPELGYNTTVVDYLLESAKKAHMNMIRVWGGGVYESDYFYQKCDELGILVWQDLMFACSMYPAYEGFLSSVIEEVKQNIRRLQHHPSVAIWAGNNENEAALRGNWYDTVNEFDLYKAQYVNLYVNAIRPIVTVNDPTRHYLISSPTNGIESEKEGYIANNPYDPKYGDTHYYNYQGPLWSMSTYPHTRFGSEYGFQSYPSAQTISTAGAITPSEAFTLMKYRQHSPSGDLSMKLQINNYLKSEIELPTEELTKEIIYYSQVIQSEAMRTETEFYRQSRYDWWTMGALYWQLNDVWQTPSWSSIDFSGRWKMLHHASVKFFAPVLVSPRLNPDRTIEIYLINDELTQVDGTVVVENYVWGNSKPSNVERQNVTLNPSSVGLSSLKSQVPLNTGLTFYKYQILDQKTNRKLSPDNYIFAFDPKEVNNDNYKENGIEIAVKLKSIVSKTHTFEFTLSSSSMHLFVFLELEYPGQFTDNGFHLIDEPVVLEFTTSSDVDLEQLKKALVVNTVPYGQPIIFL